MLSIASSDKRFRALDGCRGFCALMVTLFHFNAYSHFRELGIVENAFLFVDFFFVLSGFVITANYAQELRDGFGVGRFMLLRWGRLYPLHLATLLVFVALECLPWLLPGLAPEGLVPFSAPGKDIGSLVANLLLAHGFGFESTLSWNFPSWSISAEFGTYFLFALAATTLPVRWLLRLLIASAFVAPVVLGLVSPRNMDATFDYGLIRAAGGFAAGAIAFVVYSNRQLGERSQRFSQAAWTIAEVVLVAAVFSFVSLAGTSKLSLLAPLMFFLAVLVFALEQGLVSRWLTTRWTLTAGMLSYSIYMVHAPLQHVAMMAARAAERVCGLELMTPAIREGRPVMLLGLERWQGDVAVLLMIAAVLGVSTLTYRWIETPGRLWTRHLVERHLPPRMRRKLESRSRALPS